MKRIASNIALITLSSVILIYTLNWAVNVSPKYMFLNSAKVETTGKGIENLNIRFSGKTVFLDVYLNKIMTCNEIEMYLGVTVIPVKDKKYFPSCIKISNNFAQIIYTESDSL